jgi:hypothetical protein
MRRPVRWVRKKEVIGKALSSKQIVERLFLLRSYQHIPGGQKPLLEGSVLLSDLAGKK